MTTHKDSYTADDLVDVLNRVQASAQPIDMASGDDDARIPAALWREFVDAHAALLHERAQRTALNPRAAWPFPEKREHGPNSLPPLTQAMIDAAGAAIWGHASIEKERLIRKAYRAMDDTRTTATHSPTKGA